MSVNEALANVIRHAYRGKTDRPIRVAAEGDGEQVVVTIRDWGSGVNPETLPPRRRDPEHPGGLGLLCLKALMDQVLFEPQQDGMLLTLVKRRRGGGCRQR